MTDDKDRRTLMSILTRFYTPAFLEKEHAIVESGDFYCPEDGTRADYMRVIDSFPLVAR